MCAAIRCGCAGFATLLCSLLAQADPPSFQQLGDATRVHSPAAREAQYQALLELREADVEYGQFGRVRQVQGRTGLFVPAAANLKPGDSADALFKVAKRILMADGEESLVVRDTGLMPSGTPFGNGRYFFTDQQIGGIPVLGSPVNFVVDPKGQIVMINSLFVPQGQVSKTPQISLEMAKAELEAELAKGSWADPGSVQIGEEGSLAFWTDGGTLDRPVLLWMIPVQYTKNKQPQYDRFGVDAVTGEIRYAQPMSFNLHR